VRIAVLTAQHFITGDAQVTDQRLSDYLGNILAKTLKLTGATTARLTAPSEMVAKHAEANIASSEIIAAFEQAGGPAPRRPGAIVRKHPHAVSLIAGPVEIRGNIHSLSERQLDIREMLTTLGDRFVPVTEAQVGLSIASHRLTLPAVMVNVRRISYMALEDAPASPAHP
jgi:hypothetical protein